MKICISLCLDWTAGDAVIRERKRDAEVLLLFTIVTLSWFSQALAIYNCHHLPVQLFLGSQRFTVVITDHSALVKSPVTNCLFINARLSLFAFRLNFESFNATFQSYMHRSII